MEKERKLISPNQKIALARALIREEIFFWQDVYNERQQLKAPEKRRRKGPDLIDSQILDFIKEREEALKDDETLINYLLGRYSHLVDERRRKYFDPFSDMQSLNEEINLLEQLLF